MTRLGVRASIAWTITLALDYGYCLVAAYFLDRSNFWMTSLVFFMGLLVVLIALSIRRTIAFTIVHSMTSELHAVSVAEALAKAKIPQGVVLSTSEGYLAQIADDETLPVPTRIAAAIHAGRIAGAKEAALFRGFLYDQTCQKALVTTGVKWPESPATATEI